MKLKKILHSNVKKKICFIRLFGSAELNINKKLIKLSGRMESYL